MPRYRLLLERLIKHTDMDHADFPLLRKAEKEIHELMLEINNDEQMVGGREEEEESKTTLFCCL